MRRYIDADKLESELFRDGIAGIFLGYPRRRKYTIGEIRGMLKNERIAPTADVVEVVRCKDCKHHPNNGGDCDRSITHTSRDYLCEVNTYRYINIDFCSYGERSENGTPN